LGKQVFVSSDDDFKNLAVEPGDEIIWRDGTYIDQGINLNASGTEEARLILRAETPGGVILKGKSFVRFGGNYITVSGFHFYNGDDYDREVGSSVFQFRANNGNVHAHHCRVTQCAITDMNSWEQDVDDDDEDGDSTELIFHNSKWVQLYGTNHRVDHCYFANKKVRGALLLAEMVPQDGEDGTPYESYNHRIDHNFFGPIPEGFESNEFETIRLGTSDYANFNGNMIVEDNYFYRCDGEIEVVSNKSSNNTYRNNVFIGCKGSLVMRHGDDCTIDGNIILGMGVSDSGGIRLSGEGHTVINNYVSGVRGTGLRAALCLRSAGGVSTGDTNGGYEQVRFALIAFNTFYDSTQSWNIGENGSKDNKYPPTASTIANNIVVSDQGTLVSWDKVPTSMTYEGNLLYGSSLGISGDGFIEENPLLENNGWGLFMPGPDSPALGGSIGEYATVPADLDGESRPATLADVGADQVSLDGIPLAPMAPASVGPEWIRSDNPIEIVSLKRTPFDELLIQFKQKDAHGIGSFGMESASGTDSMTWKPMPVFIDGPNEAGEFSSKVPAFGEESGFWRVVNH